MSANRDLMRNAWEAGTVIPAFNTPYLPMVAPIVQALRDTNAFGFVQVARLEWEKFDAKSLEAVRNAYDAVNDHRHTRLHLDHVPAVDEDNERVPYLNIIATALELGYESVMVDGSRLPLAENIACTRQVTELAHAADVPVEAELGAVLGHEAGPMPPYEELFRSALGFTDPEEAERFVAETDVDWLSVAIGNIHGAISAAKRATKKVAARLNITHLDRLAAATRIPLVLHGGSGIRKTCMLDAIRHGIAKVNVGTALRQAYEAGRATSATVAVEATYAAAVQVLRVDLELVDSAKVVNPAP